MYIVADCCSQSYTVPVMFSVHQPPSQHAVNLQSSPTSNFSNMQPRFKIQQIRNKTNYTGVTLNFKRRMTYICDGTPTALIAE